MAVDRRYCRDCGAENRAASFYCRQCGTRLDHQYSETGTPVPDAASLSGADAGSDQDQGRDDRELARPAAPAAGTDPWPRRPWALTLFAVVVVLGVSALVGWQTQWPGTIFGARNAAAVTSVAPSTAPPAAAQPSGQPGSFAPSSGAAGLSQAPGSAAASANADDPASVVDAYFAAINAHDYRQAWTLGGSNSGASSYAQFAAGFASTSNDAVTVLSTSGDVATAQLVAVQDDGSTKTFQGTYTVTDGVITTFHVVQTG